MNKCWHLPKLKEAELMTKPFRDEIDNLKRRIKNLCFALSHYITCGSHHDPLTYRNCKRAERIFFAILPSEKDN